MIYIYDILLNFNNDFYEFYEWEKNDYIFHVKKIPLFKTNTDFMELLLTKKIKMSRDFANLISSKVDLFGSKKNKILEYACLLTDGYKVIGIELNDNFEISRVSDLLLDEANDVIEISSRCKPLDFEYTILGSKNNHYFLTRYENNIKVFLESEIKRIYKNKEESKLKYLYFEYFNNIIDDVNIVYKELKKSLKEGINDKHLILYNLLNLKDECENIRNLTK